MTTSQAGQQPLPLVARTVAGGDVGDLLAVLPADEPTAWVRRGDGLVGWGVAARMRPSVPDRFVTAQAW